LRKNLLVSGLAAGALAISGLAAVLPGASAMPAHPSAAVNPARHAVRVCSAKSGVPVCQALVMTAADGKVRGSAKPLGTAFTPADIQKAYKLQGLKSNGRTVAIVDGYGYSGLESDLAKFRSTYGLPACTTANGCLTIIDEHGGTNYPPDNSGWDLEQALDVDMVSSACPDCKIVMVQAQLTTQDFLTAENTAAGWPGVVAVSNSWTDGQMSNNSAMDHPGIAITAATGDGGFDGGEWPADDTNVVGVGGTSVFPDGSSRGYHETVWNGAGSGCGTNQKPAWQNKANTTCNTKADGDIAGPADPSNGGLNIYCGSFCGGFEQVGGTSEATPMIAAVYALSGKTKGYPAKFVYTKKHRKHLYDVTSGSNGGCGVPVCTARKGWDGPTGMGTPKGVKAF
jgi:subtilase family serine protease